MTENLTHWKKLTNPDYLGAYALQPGEDLIATIKEVTQADVNEMQKGVELLDGTKFKSCVIKILEIKERKTTRREKGCSPSGRRTVFRTNSKIPSLQ